jgi:hypothetical protein
MRFFFLIIIPLIISCHNNPKNPEQVKEVQKKDTNIATNNIVDFDSIEVRRQRLLDTNYTFMNRLLDSSLRIAYKQGFEQPFALTLDSNFLRFKNMYATISFGHLFSNERKHLLIKRYINEYNDYETSLYSDIYLLDKNTFKKVAADTSDNGYGEDYFEDANHDGYKDYIVQSYSGAGCCPRNLEMAFLYNHKNGHFKAMYLFNREIDSATNLFYETSYGLGDYITLYKYKWSGLKKVLLEEISVTPPPEGKKPISYTVVTYPVRQQRKTRQLPVDFRKLKMSDYITKVESK